MSGIKIQGGSSGNIAEVDANNNITENKPTDESQAGYDTLIATNGVLYRNVEASDNYRWRTAVDSPLFFDKFAGASINTGLWVQTVSTETITISGGFAILNGGSTTSLSAASMLNTRRWFPVYKDGRLRLDFGVIITTGPLFGVMMEMGFGIPGLSTVSPTDGAFFRVSPTGQLEAVASNNSLAATPVWNETVVPINLTLLPNVLYNFSIRLDIDWAYYFVNNVLVASIQVAPVSDGTVSSNEQKVFFRHMEVFVPTVANQLKIAYVNVTLMDIASARMYRDALTGLGANSQQGQTGYTTLGTLANFANSAAPTTIASLSNTTAAGAGQSSLGGQWLFTVPASAETDYIIFGFQVPAATAALPGKTLYITDVAVDAAITTVLGGATILQWAIGVGSTAVSLATSEAAGTKSPRILTLGMMGMPTTTVGQTFRLNNRFESALVANQSEWVHIICKVPLSGGSGAVRGTVMINGYFE